MFVSFNQSNNYNRQQRTNFGMLPEGIATRAPVAEKFVSFIDKYSKNLTPEDKVMLVTLSETAEDLGSRSYIAEAVQILGLKPKQ